jgi:hypothetical protein
MDTGDGWTARILTVITGNTKTDDSARSRLDTELSFKYTLAGDAVD